MTASDLADGIADAVPFGRQPRVHLRAGLRQPVETLLALVLFAPFAFEQTLGFEPAQQRVERALVDRHAVVLQRLAQGVAVLLAPERSQDGKDEAAAPQ